MYIVYLSHVAQSIPLELDEAKEFAVECGGDFEVRCEETYELVYSAAEYEYSPYYVEIECDMPEWGVDTLEIE